MASSYDEYYEKLYEMGKGSVSKQETALDNAAKAEKELINKAANEELDLINQDYETSVAEAKQGYEDAFRRNATQRAINERYLERKAAEMGLTDSGLNRTQQTANQLSYANQNAALDAGLLKDVNTLSAAMKARKMEVEKTRNNNLSAVDTNLESGKAKLWSDYDSSVRSSAEDLYNNDIKDADKAAGALNDLVGLLSKSNDPEDDNFLSPTAKKAYIESYINQYGFSPALKSLLGRVGYNVEHFSEDAYNEYMKNYMFNPNISRDEKINRFRAVYSNYGPPSDSIYRAIENAPNKYTGGISLETLINAIGRN